MTVYPVVRIIQGIISCGQGLLEAQRPQSIMTIDHRGCVVSDFVVQRNGTLVDCVVELLRSRTFGGLKARVHCDCGS
jgi:hypothetical protein